MQSLSVCWCFRLVLLIPGVWGALTACQATGRVSIGDFTPLLLSSMLSARAAREPRRIYRRIGYWHAPQDQGRSIPHWGRGQGSYFWGVRRRPRLDRCWRTYGNANWPSGHAQPSVLGVFEDSKPDPPNVREDRIPKLFAIQKILGWAIANFCVFGVMHARMHAFFFRMHPTCTRHPFATGT